MDITEFLTARLGEDEKVTRAALGRWSPAWSVDPEEWATGVGVQDGEGRSVAAVHGTYRAEHIARHDPARVLADIAAKRRILVRHSGYDFPANEDDGPGDYAWTPSCDHCLKPWPCLDLRDLATLYAEHPDFDPAWRTDD